MFVPVQQNEIPKSKSVVYGRKIKDLKAFLDSGLPCAEYIIPEGRDALHESNGFYVAIRRHNFPVKLSLRSGRIFFSRKED